MLMESASDNMHSENCNAIAEVDCHTTETDGGEDNLSESTRSRPSDSMRNSAFSSFTHWLMVVFLLMVSGVKVLGQQEKKPPKYESERAQEDYRYLAKDSLYQGPHDFFDPIKFIPLSSTGKFYLSIGGEIRSQYERFTHLGWGNELTDRDGYLLQRFVVHTDWHFGPHVRVFGQVKSGLVVDNRVPPDLPDEDRLDLHQAFVDLTTGWDSSLTLRLGRQEMSYGSSRLISLREGPNVRQSFDGARLMAKLPQGWQLDGFVTRPTTTQAGVFDDRPDPALAFWGVYGAFAAPKQSGGVDLYYLGLSNREAQFQQGTAHERRHSAGLRWWGAPGSFHFNTEAVYQFGRFGAGRIRAGTVSAELGHAWLQSWLTPDLTLRAEFISGDRDSANTTLQTFNPLFPKGAYFGQVALVGPANLVDLHPILTLHPFSNPALAVRMDAAFFWRASCADAFYGTPYVLERTGNRAQSAHVGNQYSIESEWDVQRHWKLELFLTYFRAGTFLRKSGKGRNLTYISPRVTFLF
jgi:hypothetical protein